MMMTGADDDQVEAATHLKPEQGEGVRDYGNHLALSNETTRTTPLKIADQWQGPFQPFQTKAPHQRSDPPCEHHQASLSVFLPGATPPPCLFPVMEQRFA